MQKRKCFLLLTLGVLFCLCTFDDIDDTPLTMSIVGTSSDTVSLWPSLSFLLHPPLADSALELQIIPNPGTIYSTALNTSRDTAKLTVTGLLKGSTLYNITLKNTITAKNGKTLSPEESIFEIVTHPSEKEPNDQQRFADTLWLICFGISTPMSDTDYYFLPAPHGKTLTLASHQGLSGYRLVTLNDVIIHSDVELAESKSITIADTISTPLYCSIFSVFENDSRYEVRFK